MAWFSRKDKGILTPTESKREVPDGLWFKSPGGKIIQNTELPALGNSSALTFDFTFAADGSEPPVSLH